MTVRFCINTCIRFLFHPNLSEREMRETLFQNISQTMFGKKYRTNEINQTYPTTFAFDRNVQCLNLDPVGTDTFFWIRNNFFLIRIQAKMKNRYMVNILLFPLLLYSKYIGIFLTVITVVVFFFLID